MLDALNDSVRPSIFFLTPVHFFLHGKQATDVEQSEGDDESNAQTKKRTGVSRGFPTNIVKVCLFHQLTLRQRWTDTCTSARIYESRRRDSQTIESHTKNTKNPYVSRLAGILWTSTPNDKKNRFSATLTHPGCK